MTLTGSNNFNHADSRYDNVKALTSKEHVVESLHALYLERCLFHVNSVHTMCAYKITQVLSLLQAVHGSVGNWFVDQQKYAFMSTKSGYSGTLIQRALCSRSCIETWSFHYGVSQEYIYHGDRCDMFLWYTGRHQQGHIGSGWPQLTHTCTLVYQRHQYTVRDIACQFLLMPQPKAWTKR